MKAIPGRNRLPVHQGSARLFGYFHEMFEETALQSPGILHADNHTGQHALKNPGRRKIKCRPDLAQILCDCISAFRAADAKTRDEAHGKRERIVSNPCHWQVGEHLFVGSDLVERIGIERGHQKILMRQHNTFRPPSRARGIEDNRSIRPGAFLDF